MEVGRKELQRKGLGEWESRTPDVGRESTDVQETPYCQGSETDEKQEK